MKIHPRTIICRKAEQDLFSTILAIKDRHGLTDAEDLAIVSKVAADHVGFFAKMRLRYERHGNYETPADEDVPAPSPKP